MKLHHDNVEYLIDRLHRVVGLLRRGEVHMAMAKVLADIAALKSLSKPRDSGKKKARTK